MQSDRRAFPNFRNEYQEYLSFGYCLDASVPVIFLPNPGSDSIVKFQWESQIFEHKVGIRDYAKIMDGKGFG